ncbi:S41 family peptidase [Niastella yeongjuensis]|nr:S41 family peptidase [Niastella yeongjuensis]SEN57060.1 Peptidase family S41 [Niastella yeongjuensis]
MKRLFSLVLCCTFMYNSQAQTSVQVTQLATLGKVWGFLKCFHPAAAKGNPDWDNELLRMIPLAEDAESKSKFDSLLEAWYRSLPAAKLAEKPVNWHADSIVTTFSEKDIRKFPVSKWLKGELVRLYEYHVPDTNCYATRYFDGYRFDHIIHDEKAYDLPLCPESSVRMLALFRYWNTINYFYPHKARIPGWDTVLTAYIPRFMQARYLTQYQQAVLQLIHELPDSHSFIKGPGFSNNMPPFRVAHVKDKYLIAESDDSIAKKWDFRVGDEIVSVNGKPVSQIEKELLQVTTGTNRPSRYRNIAMSLLQNDNSIVQVGLERNGKIVNDSVKLNDYLINSLIPRSPDKPYWEEVEKGVWYVRFCTIKEADTLRRLFSDIHNAKAVIWEMRDYPNYKVSTEVYKYFFPSKTTFSERENAWDYYPGAFVKGPLDFIPEEKEPLIYNGPLIILVDELTQSLSESVAMALKQRSNSFTIGRQTAGTTGNITWLSLPGAIEVSYTGVGVEGAQGSFKQGDGVTLDQEVPSSPEYLLQGRDPILEQALKYAQTPH